jgi:hypothetical protein
MLHRAHRSRIVPILGKIIAPAIDLLANPLDFRNAKSLSFFNFTHETVVPIV